jgi:hypothetical protein
MKEYICHKCNKIFNRKCNYQYHCTRKTSCLQNKNINYIAEFPEKLAEFPEKLAEFPEKTAEFPEKLAEFPEKLAEFPEKLAEFPEKLAEFPEKTAEFTEKTVKNHKNQVKFGCFSEFSANSQPYLTQNIDYLNNNIEFSDKITNNESFKYYLLQNQCCYCKKKFTRKDNTIYHMRYNCKIRKNIEKKKGEIFEKLKLEEIEKKEQLKKIAELNKEKNIMKEKMEEDKKEKNDMKKNMKKLEKMVNDMKKKMEKQEKIINNNDNSIIDNSQNNQLYLVNYNKENLNNLNEKKVIANLNRGFQAPVEMTRLIHFDEEHPEYHNVYIPKINEKYGMVFKDDVWRLMDKSELVDDIYESKRSYIVENLQKFIEKIDPKRLKSLKQFLNSEEHEISIINTKEDIKKVLYENRRLAMDRRREIESNKRKKK